MDLTVWLEVSGDEEAVPVKLRDLASDADATDVRDALAHRVNGDPNWNPHINPATIKVSKLPLPSPAKKRRARERGDGFVFACVGLRPPGFFCFFFASSSMRCEPGTLTAVAVSWILTGM